MKEVVKRKWKVTIRHADASDDSSDCDAEEVRNIESDTQNCKSLDNDNGQVNSSDIGQKKNDDSENELPQDDKIDKISEESSFARRLLDLIIPLQKFLDGETMVRYVFVLGDPFNNDVLVKGFIDTLLCNPSTFELSICLRKTRSGNFLPDETLRRVHFLQAMLYKTLLNDLIAGKLNLDMFVKWRRLDLNKELDDENVIKKIDTLGFTARTLRKLFEISQEKLKSFSPVGEIKISYSSQIDLKPLGILDADLGESWLQETYQHLISFWKKERTVKEMDIEDGFKCKNCPYFNFCKWRNESPGRKYWHKQRPRETRTSQQQRLNTEDDWKYNNRTNNNRQLETEGIKSERYDRSAINNWRKKDVGPNDQRYSSTSFQGFKSNENEQWRLENNDRRNQQNKSVIPKQPICNCNWRQKYHNENCMWRKKDFNN